MKTNRGMLSCIVVAMLMVASPAWGPAAHAAISVNLDFSGTSTTGAGSPTDDGYAFVGNASGTQSFFNGSGQWVVDTGGETTAYSNNSLPDSLSVGATVLSGEIGVKHTTFSNLQDDTTLLVLRDDRSGADYHVEMFAKSGILIVSGSTGFGTTDSIAVANTDGQQHTYGWELTGIGTTPIVKYFFDGSQVGAASYIAGFTVNNGNTGEHYFGDGTGGTVGHRDDYDFFTINESLIPEPGSLALLGISGLLMLTRRRKA